MANDNDVKVKVGIDIDDALKGLKTLKQSVQDSQRQATSGGKQAAGIGSQAKAIDPKKIAKERRDEDRHNKGLIGSLKSLFTLTKKQRTESDKINNNYKKRLGLSKSLKKVGSAVGSVGGSIGGTAGKAVSTVGKGLGSAAGALGGGAMALGGLALGGVMAGVTAALGMIVGAVTSTMRTADEEYRAFSMAASRNIGHGRVTDSGDGSMIDRGRAAGFRGIETAQHASQVATQTGQIGATNVAQIAARTFGGDVGSVAGFMGELTRSGNRFDQQGGGQGNRVLRQVLQNAVSSGLDRSRTGEYLSSVSAAVKAAGSRTGGDIDAAGISARIAAFGQLGAGWQGQRGASALAQIDAGMKSGGRDEWSQMRSLQAQGFGSLSGNGVSYYDALKSREQGFFGEGGQGRLQNEVRSLMSSASGNREEAVLQAQSSGIFGNLSISQLEDVFKVGLGEGSQEELAEMTERLQEESMDMDARMLQAIEEGNSEVLEHMMTFDRDNLAQGKEIFMAMKEIERFSRDLINMFMPLAIDILQAIAYGVKLISGAIGPTAAGAVEALEASKLMTKLTTLDKKENLTDRETEERDRALARMSELQASMARGGGLARLIPGFESDEQAAQRRSAATSMGSYLQSRGLQSTEVRTPVEADRGSSMAAPTAGGSNNIIVNNLIEFADNIAGRRTTPTPNGGPRPGSSSGNVTVNNQ